MASREARGSEQPEGIPAKKAAAERRCAECGEKLSAYNPGPNCWRHTLGHPWRGPHARPKF